VINLTDFYLVRRGQYSIAEFFKVDGIYGRVTVFALVIYAISLGLESLFVNFAWFEGPIAKQLDGGDISWIVGGVFSLVAYYFVARRRLPEYRAPEAVPSAGPIPSTGAIPTTGAGV
jgi:NCS1 family nucleobase:cation symporter-1